MKKNILILIICLPVLGYAQNNKSNITFTSLINEMLNRDALAKYPDPAYHLFQTSSWDRSELNRQDPKSWFGNKDYDNYVRKEKNGNRTEYVIMDAEGPGAITRWWIPQSHLLGNRTVRVYLDHQPNPVIEENYENLISGSSFVKWPFAFISSDEKDSKYQYSMPVGFPKQVGNDFYLPVPFSKSCKVTLDDSTFYYAIDYRIYEPGTKIVSFTKEDYFKNRNLVNSTGQKLLEEYNPITIPFEKSENISKSESTVVDLPSGNNAIEQIRLKINSKDNKQMNRAVILKIEVDGIQTVWSPVSEFFGGGVYARPVKNRNVEVKDDGWMICNFEMPYKNAARIILQNYGDQPVKSELIATVKYYKWDDHSMYFHADWHEEAPLKDPPFKDWNYIEIEGKGKYAGDVLTVYSVPKAWWGEGDEKIYINGESFPSQLGTGTEDYYGYAWGTANFYSSPFISMPARDARGKDNWSGYTTVERMRLMDEIPFEKSLKVDIEACISQPGVSYSVTCFWYGAEQAKSNVKPDTIAIIRKLPDYDRVNFPELPGKVYPDPSGNKSLIGKGEGGITYAGDQLDLLPWRDKSIVKKLDGDGDNILGTAGYCFFGDKIITMYAELKDSAVTLPRFITNLKPQQINDKSPCAYLSFPDPLGFQNLKGLYKTGLIEIPGSIAEKGVVSFTLGKNVPSTFRLGVMLDNADTFTKVGKQIWVTDNKHGNSSKIVLAQSNRVPDWYFFDIKNMKEGDVITIHGTTEKSEDIFTIGGLTFDINKM